MYSAPLEDAPAAVAQQRIIKRFFTIYSFPVLKVQGC